MKHLILFFLLIYNINPAFASETDTLKISAQSEGYTLNGVLLKNSHHTEKLPVIIFLVGSGGTSSHQSNYTEFVKFFFEEALLNQGFAIVYFDKRGVGDSEGVWYNTTFEQRALDAKNVALKVQKFDFIDTNNIHLVGHSQGGWIAQIAVSTYPELFAGAISMAGPTFGVRKQLIDEYQSMYICNGGIEDEPALIKATNKANRDLFFISLLGFRGNWKQLKLIKGFEADTYIRSISKPFLFLFADNDELVNDRWAMEDFSELFPDGPPSFIETYTAREQNHSFRVAPACYRGSNVDLPYSETTRDKMVEWLMVQTH
ncbi:MAG: alpha/beta hydrolase [Balneolaceae bacterium]